MNWWRNESETSLQYLNFCYLFIHNHYFDNVCHSFLQPRTTISWFLILFFPKEVKINVEADMSTRNFLFNKIFVFLISSLLNHILDWPCQTIVWRSSVLIKSLTKYAKTKATTSNADLFNQLEETKCEGIINIEFYFIIALGRERLGLISKALVYTKDKRHGKWTTWQ